MANVHQFTFNLFQEHTMILKAVNGECIIVDPGYYDDEEKARFHEYLRVEGLTPRAILITHCHIDHIWGAKDAQDTYGIPLFMGPENVEMFEHFDEMSVKLGLRAPEYDLEITRVADGDTVKTAGFNFKVITTPGHSPGGVCYLEEEEKIMFTGDTLFAGTIGRTDLFQGDYDELIRSIMEKLIWLDPAITIYPGHGPSSTIGRERSQNPFLEPFNEKEEMEFQYGTTSSSEEKQ